MKHGGSLIPDADVKESELGRFTAAVSAADSGKADSLWEGVRDGPR